MLKVENMRTLYVKNRFAPCPLLRCQIAIPAEERTLVLDAEWRVSCRTLLEGLEGSTAAERLFTAPQADAVEMFASLILALQQLSGSEVERALVNEESGATVAYIEHEALPVAGLTFAASIAAWVLNGFIGRDPAPRARVAAGAAAARKRFLRLAAPHRIDEDTRYLLRQACALDIPVVHRGNRYLLLGHGRYGRVMRERLTDDSPALAVQLASDRHLTLNRLADAWLPVPRHTAVGNAEEAVVSAERIGWPVIVMPRVGASSANFDTVLATHDELRRAVAAADARSGLMVAEAIEGQAYRLLVVGGQVVAVVRRAGGMTIDVTDRVHPDNADLARWAAAALGLNIAGVDLVGPDIAQSWTGASSAITGVVANPLLRPHVAPDQGSSREVAKPILDHLFPLGTPRRIPIAAVTGTNGKTTTCNMLAAILEQHGMAVGLATTAGVWVGKRQVRSDDCAGGEAAARLLRDRGIDVAVLETARGGIIKNGLAFDACDVAALTNISRDHIGEDGINSLEEMARVKGAIVEVARDTVVLNGDDRLCRRLAPLSPARHLCWATLEEGNPLVETHIASGGRAVRLVRGAEGPLIELWDAGASTPVVEPAEIPATIGGLALHNTANAMFAVGLAHGLGVPVETIRAGLIGYRSDCRLSPGRLNFFDGFPFTVMSDAGKSESGYRALCRVVDGLPVTGRRICVLSMSGRLPNDLIRALGSIVAGHFDHFICFADAKDAKRGRGPREVPDLITQALLEASVPEANIEVIPEQREAVHRAINLAEPGGLVVISANITESQDHWKWLEEFRSERMSAWKGCPVGRIPPSP